MISLLLAAFTAGVIAGCGLSMWAADVQPVRSPGQSWDEIQQEIGDRQ